MTKVYVLRSRDTFAISFNRERIELLTQDVADATVNEHEIDSDTLVEYISNFMRRNA